MTRQIKRTDEISPNERKNIEGMMLESRLQKLRAKILYDKARILRISNVSFHNAQVLLLCIVGMMCLFLTIILYESLI